MNEAKITLKPKHTGIKAQWNVTIPRDMKDKCDKVLDMLNEHLERMNNMYIRTNDTYYKEAVEYTKQEIEQVKRNKNLHKYNLGE